MNKVLPIFEHRAQPVIPLRQFIFRLAHSSIIAIALVAISLFIGMVGYHALEDLRWIDAFLNASMLLGGMGPVDVPVTAGGKLFAGLYALYCGLAASSRQASSSPRSRIASCTDFTWKAAINERAHGRH